MRKIALVDYGKLELQEVEPIAKLEPGTVKVAVKACSICGSDIALYRGFRSLKDERYFGHEFSGVIVDAGAGDNGLKVGMHVASELSRTCGRCWNCQNGMENYCRSMNEALIPGGFSAETLVLNTQDYSFLSPIPESLPFEVAALAEPVSCALQIAKHANLQPCDSVTVFGLGAMGILSALILKSWGAGTVIGVDVNKPRLQKVGSLGIFDAVLDSTDENWLDQLYALVGPKGSDRIIEATGVSAVLGNAFKAARPGGRIVVGSVYHGKAGDLELLPIMRKELTVIGAKGPFPHRTSSGKSATIQTVLQLKDELTKLISIYDYQDALRAFADAKSGEAIKAVVRFN